MTTKTDIWNLALAFLGQPALNELDDNDRARKCKLFYPLVKDAALRAHNWTFARVTAPLVRRNIELPAFAGGQAYAYPKAALKLLAVFPKGTVLPVQYDGKKNGFPWKIVSLEQGKIIVCAGEQVWAEYISGAVDESVFDPCFTEYLAWRLARSLCTTLTGDDNLLALCDRGAAQALDAAQYANINDEQHFARPDCSYLK